MTSNSHNNDSKEVVVLTAYWAGRAGTNGTSLTGIRGWLFSGVVRHSFPQYEILMYLRFKLFAEKVIIATDSVSMTTLNVDEKRLYVDKQTFSFISITKS